MKTFCRAAFLCLYPDGAEGIHAQTVFKDWIKNEKGVKTQKIALFLQMNSHGLIETTTKGKPSLLALSVIRSGVIK